jgi:hypothetical protein
MRRTNYYSHDPIRTVGGARSSRPTFRRSIGRKVPANAEWTKKRAGLRHAPYLILDYLPRLALRVPHPSGLMVRVLTFSSFLPQLDLTYRRP